MIWRMKVDPVLQGTLELGEVLVIGKRIYGRCAGCDSIVQVNKRILGAMHFCPESS